MLTVIFNHEHTATNHTIPQQNGPGVDQVQDFLSRGTEHGGKGEASLTKMKEINRLLPHSDLISMYVPMEHITCRSHCHFTDNCCICTNFIHTVFTMSTMLTQLPDFYCFEAGKFKNAPHKRYAFNASCENCYRSY